MKLHLSRVLAILVAQAALNVLLSSWLYNEYVHNKFLQEYMAKFWTANIMPVSLGLVAAVKGTGALRKSHRLPSAQTRPLAAGWGRLQSQALLPAGCS
jgi:hypothetical protein